MDCTQARELIPLANDRELDARTEAELDAHVAGCADCQARREALSSLSGAVRSQASYYRAPPDLRARLATALPGSAAAKLPAPVAAQAAPQVPRPVRPPRWSFGLPVLAGGFGWRLLNGGGALAAVAMVALLMVVRPFSPSAEDRLEDDAVADHARAVLTGHVTDVISSDQHTVKPWLSAKLDFSPPVLDLASDGFPLAGGRLDYLDQRPVGTLVYRRRQHVVDVFVWPAPEAGVKAPALLRTERGWNVVGWSANGMSYRAVSDLDPNELRQLGTLLSAPLTGPG